MKILISAFAAITMSLFAAPALAHEPKQIILPEDEENREIFEQFGFAEAVISGDTLYASGVVAGTYGGREFEDSVRGNFRYLGTILERAGFTWDDVVDMTTYHTDLIAQIDIVSAVKKEFMPGATHAWTAIDVDRLYPDEGLVEIKIVARKSE